MEQLTYLPCFKPRSYPSPVLSVAQDHPVYINGTKLVNGHPVLTGNKTDESRIEEFKKCGFSREYIQELTDSSFYSYYFGTGIKGTKCNYGSSLPYKPSYSKIGNKTVLCDPVNDLVSHVIEIKNHEVFFNGALIASAPITGDNGRKKTLAQQLTFCKAVIYSIIPGSIQRPIKDHPSGCVVYESVSDDEYLRELITKYPAVIDNQIDDVKEEMMDKIAINALPGIIAISAPVMAEYIPEPEECNNGYDIGSMSNAVLSGSPLSSERVDEILDYAEMRYEKKERAIKTLIKELSWDIGIAEMGYDKGTYDDIPVYDEIEKESIAAMWQIINPVQAQNPANIIRSWTLPYLRVSIVEEVRA
jgi:hypothetical protein